MNPYNARHYVKSVREISNGGSNLKANCAIGSELQGIDNAAHFAVDEKSN
jgi:hypothetical protein